MKRAVTILSFLAVATAVAPGMALAEQDCFVPMANWQSRAAVVRMAQDNGWAVRRLKIDDGCYEIHATDAQGRRIEVTLQPQTLQVLSLEIERGGRDRDD